MGSTTPSVTVIQHDAGVPLGRFAGWLDDVGIRLVRAFDGEPVPAVGEVGSGLLVLGGTMNAYDDERVPWLPATRRLLSDAVDAHLPTLGICLGHQLLAVATGGRVAVGAARSGEAGLVEITWNRGAEEDPVLRGGVLVGAVLGGEDGRREDGRRSRSPEGAPVRSFQYAMHDDAVSELPPGAERLASSPDCAVQAMRVGSALGVQFHPEATPELIGEWARRTGATGPAVDDAVAGTHDDDVARVASSIARAFAAQVRA